MFANKELDAIKFLLTYWRRAELVFAGRWDPDNGRWCFENKGVSVCVHCVHINVDARVCVFLCMRECVVFRLFKILENDLS